MKKFEFTEVKQEMMSLLTVNEFVAKYGYVQLVQALKHRIKMDLKEEPHYYNIFNKYQLILDETIKNLKEAMDEYTSRTSETPMDKAERILKENNILINTRNNNLKLFNIKTNHPFTFANSIFELFNDHKIKVDNISADINTYSVTVVVS